MPGRAEIQDTAVASFLSYLEAEAGASPYTLRNYRQALLEFGQWHEPREIASIAKLALITRTGDYPPDLDSGFADGPPPPTTVVPVTRIDLSATLIRSRVSEGLSVRYLVPESVRRIIEANNLYLNGV